MDAAPPSRIHSMRSDGARPLARSPAAVLPTHAPVRPLLVLALVSLARCAPSPRAIVAASSAQSAGATSRTIAATDDPRDAQPHPRDTAPTPLLRVQNAPQCPLSFADADVELARVSGVAITACDVALLSIASLREGGAPLSARQALARAVLDAAFAREASARPGLLDDETRERVDRTLSDAVVRDAARAVFIAPDRASIERYFNEHRAELDREARVHVRAIGVESESSARAIVRELQAGAPFERLAAERSSLSGARRDEGDLGLCTVEGSEVVPRTVAQRAFALGEFGAIDPEPVRVETTVRVGRRRRPRTTVRWYVVQRLERTEAEPATLEGAARRIAFRLGSSAWREALLRQRGEVLTRARAQDPVTIDDRALRSVTVRVERAAPRARTRGRVAAPRRR